MYCRAIVCVPLHVGICEANFRAPLLLRNERNIILQALPWKLKTEHNFVLLNYVCRFKQCKSYCFHIRRLLHMSIFNQNSVFLADFKRTPERET